MTKLIVLILAASLTLTSCATMKSNTFIGATIGATAGSIGGTAIGDQSHAAIPGSLIGAASGAAIGALIGFLTEPKKEQKVEVTSAMIGKDDPDAPPMLSPKVQRVWIPDRITNDGRRYEKGHYSYEIERGTVWTMQ